MEGGRGEERRVIGERGGGEVERGWEIGERGRRRKGWREREGRRETGDGGERRGEVERGWEIGERGGGGGRDGGRGRGEERRVMGERGGGR